MDCILKKKPYPEEEIIQKHCIQWMVSNMLSSDEQLAPLAAELSTLKLSNKEYFDILYYGLPRSNKFIRYAAQKAKSDQQVKNICGHYGVSPELAKRYVKLMSDEELAIIDDLYEDKGLRKGKK